MSKQPKFPEGKLKNNNNQDEYAGFYDKRNRILKITSWTAIIALLVTTAITFGVAGAFT